MLHPVRAARSFLLLSLFILSSSLSGQAPDGAAPGEPQSVFGETVDVRVVNLEVVVVDRAGHRVSGLAPSELRLTVDGQPVAIDYFTEVHDGRVVAEGLAAEGLPPAAQGVEPGGEVGTSYLVFIDDSSSAVTRDRNIVLKGLIAELSRLQPQDRMAIVAFDGEKPVRLSGWSQSAADLRRTLQEAQLRGGRGHSVRAAVGHLMATQALGELPKGLPGLPSPPLPEPLDLVEKAPDSACMVVRQYERSLQKVAAALTATLRGFAQAPGRKVALLVAGAWPLSAKEFTLGTSIHSWPSGCRLVGPALWKPTHEVANQVGYTLYPVLTPGLPQAVAVELEDYPVPINPQGGTSHLQETLNLLARETGGEAYAGGARRNLLARVAADTRSYYWLGFTPTWKGDDRGHRIEVEVARPELKARSRLGFHDLSRQSEVTAQVESALLFGEMQGSWPLAVEVGSPLPQAKSGEETLRVPLRVTIPLDQITMTQRGSEHVAELELRVALVDEKGNRNDVPVLPVRIAGPAPRPGQKARYEVELEVRRTKQDLVAALFDPATGKLLQGRATIAP